MSKVAGGDNTSRARGGKTKPNGFLSVRPAYYTPLLLTGVGKALTFLEGNFTTGMDE